MTEPCPTIATGVCQCGAVGFRVIGPLGRSVIGQRRMCRRATGNAFAPLVHVPGVEFFGTPARFASSQVADRGFCKTCGTPLFYEGRHGQGMNLMVGALDDPDAAPPVFHCGTESRLAWLTFQNGLSAEPAKPGGLTGKTPTDFLSHQYSGGTEIAKGDT